MKEHYKIAVIGGTGKAGKYLIKELVRQGFSLKALLRNPDKLEISSHLVEKIQGDVRNYESVHDLIDDRSRSV